MKHLFLAMTLFIAGISSAIADVTEQEELCRSFRSNEKVYSLSYAYGFHGDEFLKMKRFNNAGVARDLHGNPPIIMAESSVELGMEIVKVVPSGDKRCDQEVKIIQVGDADGNNMDLRISLSQEIDVDGFPYFAGRFESLNMDGQPLPQLYKQLACSKTLVAALKPTLIAKCSDTGQTSGATGDTSGGDTPWAVE